MVCSIEKGIVKRQIPFFEVKGCDDGPGAKFSVLFRGRPEYELEASSLEEKYKVVLCPGNTMSGCLNLLPSDKWPAGQPVCVFPLANYYFSFFSIIKFLGIQRMLYYISVHIFAPFQLSWTKHSRTLNT